MGRCLTLLKLGMACFIAPRRCALSWMETEDEGTGRGQGRNGGEGLGKEDGAEDCIQDIK